MLFLICHYVPTSRNITLIAEQLRFTAGCWLKTGKRQVASARRKPNRFGGISHTYRCFATATIRRRKKEHHKKGRMRQKKNDLTKTRVLLIFLVFFIPPCNLNFCLFTYLFRQRKKYKKRR